MVLLEPALSSRSGREGLPCDHSWRQREKLLGVGGCLLPSLPPKASEALPGRLVSSFPEALGLVGPQAGYAESA